MSLIVQGCMKWLYAIRLFDTGVSETNMKFFQYIPLLTLLSACAQNPFITRDSVRVEASLPIAYHSAAAWVPEEWVRRSPGKHVQVVVTDNDPNFVGIIDNSPDHDGHVAAIRYRTGRVHFHLDRIPPEMVAHTFSHELGHWLGGHGHIGENNVLCRHWGCSHGLVIPTDNDIAFIEGRIPPLRDSSAQEPCEQ